MTIKKRMQMALNGLKGKGIRSLMLFIIQPGQSTPTKTMANTLEEKELEYLPTHL